MPVNAQDVPAGQSRHELCRASGWYVPTAHAAHAALPASAPEPASHSAGSAVPELGHIVPSGHAVHTSDVASDVYPGSQSAHESLDTAEYVPASQGAGQRTPCPPQK